MTYIAPIVEGHGEVEALPILLRRIAEHAEMHCNLQVNQPIRVKSGSFMNDKEYFQKYVKIAAAKAAQYHGSVLIVLDCDDQCPARLGPDLLKRARAVRGDVPCLVILAHREFETWFIAAAASLRKQAGLPERLEAPPYLDGIRDAKGWLGKHMPTGYDPITHQRKLTAAFDIDQARACASFDRFYRRFLDLLQASGEPD